MKRLKRPGWPGYLLRNTHLLAVVIILFLLPQCKSSSPQFTGREIPIEFAQEFRDRFGYQYYRLAILKQSTSYITMRN